MIILIQNNQYVLQRIKEVFEGIIFPYLCLEIITLSPQDQVTPQFIDALKKHGRLIILFCTHPEPIAIRDADVLLIPADLHLDMDFNAVLRAIEEEDDLVKNVTRQTLFMFLKKAIDGKITDKHILNQDVANITRDFNPEGLREKFLNNQGETLYQLSCTKEGLANLTRDLSTNDHLDALLNFTKFMGIFFKKRDQAGRTIFYQWANHQSGRSLLKRMLGNSIVKDRLLKHPDYWRNLVHRLPDNTSVLYGLAKEVELLSTLSESFDAETCRITIKELKCQRLINNQPAAGADESGIKRLQADPAGCDYIAKLYQRAGLQDPAIPVQAPLIEPFHQAIDAIANELSAAQMVVLEGMKAGKPDFKTQLIEYQEKLAVSRGTPEWDNSALHFCVDLFQQMVEGGRRVYLCQLPFLLNKLNANAATTEEKLQCLKKVIDAIIAIITKYNLSELDLAEPSKQIVFASALNQAIFNSVKNNCTRAEFTIFCRDNRAQLDQLLPYLNRLHDLWQQKKFDLKSCNESTWARVYNQLTPVVTVQADAAVSRESEGLCGVPNSKKADKRALPERGKSSGFNVMPSYNGPGCLKEVTEDFLLIDLRDKCYRKEEFLEAMDCGFKYHQDMMQHNVKKSDGDSSRVQHPSKTDTTTPSASTLSAALSTDHPDEKVARPNTGHKKRHKKKSSDQVKPSVVTTATASPNLSHHELSVVSDLVSDLVPTSECVVEASPVVDSSSDLLTSSIKSAKPVKKVTFDSSIPDIEKDTRNNVRRLERHRTRVRQTSSIKSTKPVKKVTFDPSIPDIEKDTRNNGEKLGGHRTRVRHSSKTDTTTPSASALSSAALPSDHPREKVVSPNRRDKTGSARLSVAKKPGDVKILSRSGTRDNGLNVLDSAEKIERLNTKNKRPERKAGSEWFGSSVATTAIPHNDDLSHQELAPADPIMSADSIMINARGTWEIQDFCEYYLKIASCVLNDKQFIFEKALKNTFLIIFEHQLVPSELYRDYYEAMSAVWPGLFAQYAQDNRLLQGKDPEAVKQLVETVIFIDRLQWYVDNASVDQLNLTQVWYQVYCYCQYALQVESVSIALIAVLERYVAQLTYDDVSKRSTMLHTLAYLYHTTNIPFVINAKGTWEIQDFCEYYLKIASCVLNDKQFIFEKALKNTFLIIFEHQLVPSELYRDYYEAMSAVWPGLFAQYAQDNRLLQGKDPEAVKQLVETVIFIDRLQWYVDNASVDQLNLTQVWYQVYCYCQYALQVESVSIALIAVLERYVAQLTYNDVSKLSTLLYMLSYLYHTMSIPLLLFSGLVKSIYEKVLLYDVQQRQAFLDGVGHMISVTAQLIDKRKKCEATDLTSIVAQVMSIMVLRNFSQSYRDAYFGYPDYINVLVAISKILSSYEPGNPVYVDLLKTMITPQAHWSDSPYVMDYVESELAKKLGLPVSTVDQIKPLLYGKVFFETTAIMIDDFKLPLAIVDFIRSLEGGLPDSHVYLIGSRVTDQNSNEKDYDFVIYSSDRDSDAISRILDHASARVIYESPMNKQGSQAYKLIVGGCYFIDLAVHKIQDENIAQHEHLVKQLLLMRMTDAKILDGKNSRIIAYKDQRLRFVRETPPDSNDYGYALSVLALKEGLVLAPQFLQQMQLFFTVNTAYEKSVFSQAVAEFSRRLKTKGYTMAVTHKECLYFIKCCIEQGMLNWPCMKLKGQDFSSIKLASDLQAMIQANTFLCYPDSNGQTIFHRAIHIGDSALLTRLINTLKDRGISNEDMYQFISTQSYQGETALYWARCSQRKAPELLKQLEALNLVSQGSNPQTLFGGSLLPSRPSPSAAGQFAVTGLCLRTE